MNEIDDRIATTWPGRPTTADVEATRLADLRAVKAEIERLAGVIDVQADITGQLGASFHALSARVAALEKPAEAAAEPMPYEADTMQHEDPKPRPEHPSPRDPTFVERVRYAINTTSQENVSDTPDFILADFVTEMLDALNSVVNRRKQWWGAHEDRQRGEQPEQGNRVGGTVPGSSAVTSASPAPPAPLVERMAEAFRKACIPAAFDIVSASEDGARAVLLVAAEELLGPVTTAEREEFGFGNIATINRVDHVLRARLAAALEACR